MAECQGEALTGTKAAPLSCNSNMLTRFLKTDAPYFRKTLTETMLRRAERLVMPTTFIQEHGDKLQEVVVLQGPSHVERSWSVQLTIRHRNNSGVQSRDCVYFGCGWTAFAKENGYRKGDQLIFWLVGRSRFVVLVYAKSPSEELVKITAPSSHYKTSHAGHSDKNEEKTGKESRIRNHRDIGARVATASQRPRKEMHEFSRTFLPSQPETTHGDISATVTGVDTVMRVHQENVKVMSVKEDSTTHQEEITARHSCSTGSKFPSFMRTLSRINVSREKSRDARLELPSLFVKEHGDKFQETVTLQGPSGHPCTVKLRIRASSIQDRVQFGHGWKAFALENGLKEGEILEFSLVALSRFVVQVISIAKKDVKNLRSRAEVVMPNSVDGTLAQNCDSPKQEQSNHHNYEAPGTPSSDKESCKGEAH